MARAIAPDGVGLVVDGNDGIMATAGIVEGFIGAGAGTETIVVAAIAAMVAGAIAMGSAKYAEAAIERDATNSLIAEERRQLSLSPAEELAELAAIYERRGLSPDLARTVATELSAHDALAAHAEAEHDIALDEAPTPPLIAAISAAGAFAVGSLVVLLSVGITWSTRLPTTFVAVALSLSLTSVVVARWATCPSCARWSGPSGWASRRCSSRSRSDRRRDRTPRDRYASASSGPACGVGFERANS